MRIARITLVALIPGLWPAAALPGEYYFDCATPGGEFTLEEAEPKPELFEGEKKLDYELVREITVREREGLCTTKAGEKFPWNARTFLYEITTVIEGVATPLTFLCEQGGSGIPASVTDCAETTTKDKRLQPAYTEGPR